MPLHRYNDACHPVFDGVVFQMTDGKTRIVYRVTGEALQDRALINGDDRNSSRRWRRAASTRFRSNASIRTCR